MDKEEMKEYISQALENATYIEIEMLYGLLLGLRGE